MKTTANYGLKKPEGTDVVNIDELNANADTVDTQLKKMNDNVGALSSLNTTAKNTLVAAINEVFQSGADVKSGTISAVNNKGASLDDDATWDDIIAAINAIARGQGNAVESQVLSGVKFSNSDGKLRTGTMPNQPAQVNAASVGTSGTKKYFRIPTGAYLTKASNGYPEIVASATQIDSNIVAGNIKKGVSICGVSGDSNVVDTYAIVPATAAHILSSKEAYVNGKKIEGTIPSKASATYTPGTSDQTISSGQYIGDTQTIKGDADLKASNIKKGISIFGVSGTVDIKSLGGVKCAMGETKETSITVTNLNYWPYTIIVSIQGSYNGHMCEIRYLCNNNIGGFLSAMDNYAMWNSEDEMIRSGVSLSNWFDVNNNGFSFNPGDTIPSSMSITRLQWLTLDNI